MSSPQSALAAGMRLFVARGDLADVRLGPDPDAPASRSLRPGEARLEIAHFALTANNITYAAFGEAMGYWRFFPAPDPARGCLPVWGFATVVESRCDSLPVGRRIWGYLPAGTYLVLTPSRHSAGGFTDAASHREGLAAVYNQYAYCDADPAWSAALEPAQAVFKPLFATSFLLDDWLAENEFFGARLLLASSASSKTALATAWCLARRRGMPGRPRCVGLSSAPRVAETAALGAFDDVLPYEALPSLPAAESAVYIDFAGGAALRAAVHAHWRGQLRASSAIGGTHWEDLPAAGAVAEPLPGPRPTLFFAPARIRQRSLPPPDGWGADGLRARLGQAWAAFVHETLAGTSPWLHFERRSGGEAWLAAYAEVLEGRTGTRTGLMLAP